MRGPAVLLAAAAASAALPASAQTLDLSGSVRARVETIAGQARPDVRPAETVVALRSILRAEWSPGACSLVAEVRDARLVGDRADSAISPNDVNPLDLVEAKAVRRVGPGGFAGELQLGRTMFDLASSRLVDSPDFRNATSSYTGATLVLERPDGAAVQAIAALPVQRLPDDRTSLARDRLSFDRERWARRLAGIYGERALGRARLGGTLVHFAESDRQDAPTRDRRLWTFGPRLLVPPAEGQSDLEIEAFVQRGRAARSTDAGSPLLPVDAWFVHAELGHTLDHPLAPRLAFQFDAVSGDRPGDRLTRFDRLFGERNGDFGPSGLFATIGRANIVASALRVSVDDGTTDAYVVVRPMWAESRTDSFSTSDVRDPSGASGRFAGTHVDSRLRHWLVKDRLRLEVHGVLLFQDGLLVDAPNATPARLTRYLSAGLVARF